MSNTATTVGAPVGTIAARDVGVGLEALVGRIALAVGDGATGATASGTLGSVPGAGALVGICVAFPTGADVAV